MEKLLPITAPLTEPVTILAALPSLLEPANYAALEQWLVAHGAPAFRGRQILDWITTRRATSFAAMTDLPATLRSQLSASWSLFSSTVHYASRDQSDATRKLLLRLADGKTIETVLLFESDRRTVCLSTQVGCAMGCVFCASGLDGVERNLSAGEMIEQLLHLRHLLPAAERLSHIVVMGMGEPTANLENLLLALEFASAGKGKGLGLSARHITISTVGMPKKIRRLADVGKPYQLAISLHAPNETLRQQIVPVAERVELAELIAAGDYYRSQTGRQVTYEYVMLADLNDHPDHARQLVKLLQGRDGFINLIPYNPVAGLPYQSPAEERVCTFAAILRQGHFTVKVRKRKGATIDAACGQLRRSRPMPSL